MTRAREIDYWCILHQRLCGGEGAEVDAVAAAAGEFFVEDVGEVGGVGGGEVARAAAVQGGLSGESAHCFGALFHFCAALARTRIYSVVSSCRVSLWLALSMSMPTSRPVASKSSNTPSATSLLSALGFGESAM